MTLTEALSLKDREVVSLVGAGVKTTLMFALAKRAFHPQERDPPHD